MRVEQHSMRVGRTWRGVISAVDKLPLPRRNTPVIIEFGRREASIHLDEGSLAGTSTNRQISGDYFELGHFVLEEVTAPSPSERSGLRLQCRVYSTSGPRAEIGCWVADEDGDGRGNEDDDNDNDNDNGNDNDNDNDNDGDSK